MSFTSPISLKGPAEVAHGWMYIGQSFNILLLGVMFTQVYLYYTQYKNDKMWLKIFVAVLFFADILNTVFNFVYLYRSLITFFGDEEYLQTGDWIFACEPALTGLIAMAVQLFFAWRVLVLTKVWTYTISIVLIAITGGVASILTAYNVGITPHFVDFRNFKATVVVWLAAEAVADVIITTILVWYLRKHKTGFQKSDMIVDRIIRLTVQTGLITMIVATLDIVFFLGDPTGTHLMINFPLAKLYSNSLMSSLNSRRGWKFNSGSAATTATGPDGQVNTTGNFEFAHGQRGLPITSRQDMVSLGEKRPPGVFVHVESHELRDVQSDQSFERSKDGKLGPDV